MQSLSERQVPALTIWTEFERIALDFVLNQAHVVLTNSLWMILQDLLTSAEQALAGSVSKVSTVLFPERQSYTPFAGYQLDLADLFLALLIIRRGGPSNLDSIIRSKNLWDAADLLANNPTLQEIADRIRIIELIKAGPAALTPPVDAKTSVDIQSAIQAAFDAAMTKTLLLPPRIFAPLQKPVHGVGFRELHVVKQHIRRFEMAEIGRIENILKGEARDHTQKHSLSNERDTFLQTQTTTDTDKELTSTDHVNIKNEAQNQVKEDTKVDAGVHAQYGGGGSFKLQADLTVSYNKSTDETKKFSSDIAKDVTQKAVNKVTQVVTQSQTTKIIETFEETEDQSFDNKNGQGHVSGVYQWVEKVYLAQVFNLGRHMLLDIMIPEPGASLLAAATIPPAGQTVPLQPDPLGEFYIDDDGSKTLKPGKELTPDQLTYKDPQDPNFYGKWIAKYQVTGVDPKPEAITVAKAIAVDSNDYSRNDIKYYDTIKLDDGYKASSAKVSVVFRPRNHDDGGDNAVLFVEVGQQQFNFVATITPNSGSTIGTLLIGDINRIGSSGNLPNSPVLLNGEEGTLPVTVLSVFTDEATVDIEVDCEPGDALIAKWQLQVYDKVVTAWQKLQADYESKVAALQFQKATVGPLGAADPETNRLTERIELKRSCVAILDYANETVRGVENIAMQDSPDPMSPPAKPDPKSPYQPILPEPILPLAQRIGASVRWFEQAFEWENIAYVSYPYFWGRRKTWIQRLNLKNDDPLFLNFLQAGYARVVVPVRLGFEWAVHFYLHTGLPWLGGSLPPIGDKSQNPLYLDIAEEIKALTGGGESNESEIPIGEPWEYLLPTTLLKLRKDDALPEWHRVGLDGKEDETEYPSDEPGNPWLWRDGTPTKPK